MTVDGLFKQMCSR